MYLGKRCHWRDSRPVYSTIRSGRPSLGSWLSLADLSELTSLSILAILTSLTILRSLASRSSLAILIVGLGLPGPRPANGISTSQYFDSRGTRGELT